MITFTLEHQNNTEIVSYLNTVKEIVEGSGLIIYPTDTLYGLGASIYCERGIEKVFSAKQRPLTLPLSVALPHTSWIEEVAVVEDQDILNFIEELLPAPITVVLPKKRGLPEMLTGGSDLIGVRIPATAFSRRLLETTGPLTSTSVNVHGEPEQISSEEIEAMDGIATLVKMFIKSEELDLKLTEKRKNPGSTVFQITGNEIGIIRHGEAEPQIIEAIGRRWGFRLGQAPMM